MSRGVAAALLAQAHVPDRVALGVHATGHAVRRVALDRLEAAVGLDGLDDADVLVPDDEVAGLGVLPGRGGDRAAALLRPGVEGVDRAEALSVVADGHAGAASEPRREVRAPRAGAGRAGGSVAERGGVRLVMPARPLLGL